jgi:hypothetical protein
LTDAEKLEVVTNCDHLTRLKFSKICPYAFTEHGALMAANVLNSPEAVKMSVYNPPPAPLKPEIGFHVRETPFPYRTRKTTSRSAQAS